MARPLRKSRIDLALGADRVGGATKALRLRLASWWKTGLSSDPVLRLDVLDAFQQVAGGRGVEDLLLLVGEAEMEGGVGEGVEGDLLGDVGQFGGVAPEEPPPDGRVEEELADVHGGPIRAPHGLRGGGLAAQHLQGGARVGAGRAGGDLEPGDRADAGKRLAAEAQRADAEEVLGVLQFRGGVAEDGQGEVRGVDALAVVGDGDPVLAPALGADVDPPGAGVEGVLHEFADDGRGTLDHLAGGDHVHDLFRKFENLSHEDPERTQPRERGVSGAIRKAACNSSIPHTRGKDPLFFDPRFSRW